MPGEALLFSATALFLALTIYRWIGTIIYSIRFGRYFQKTYPRQWDEVYGKDLTERFKKLFLLPPKDIRSPIYFVFWSTEDYGDPKFRRYKEKLKTNFVFFFVYALATFISFGIGAYIADQYFNRGT